MTVVYCRFCGNCSTTARTLHALERQRPSIICHSSGPRINSRGLLPSFDRNTRAFAPKHESRKPGSDAYLALVFGRLKGGVAETGARRATARGRSGTADDTSIFEQ